MRPSQLNPKLSMMEPPTSSCTGRPDMVTCVMPPFTSLNMVQAWVNAPLSTMTKISARPSESASTEPTARGPGGGILIAGAVVNGILWMPGLA
jgi:hypothetical protein